MPIEEIKGYDSFMRDTRDIVSGFPEAMRDASTNIARDWIAAAQSLAAAPQQSKAAQTLTMATNSEGAEIVSDLDWFGGAEFGGQGRPQTMQFPPYNGGRGYFLYPAAAQNEDRFMQDMDDGVQKAMQPWDHRE